MENGIDIKHIPHGISPYDIKEYERVPADPMENDFVIIKSIIESYSKNQKVFLKWTVNNISQPPVEAKVIKDDKASEVHCLFELGKFGKNDLITYFIEVLDGENVVQTKEYSFKVLSYFPMNKVDDIKFQNNLVELSFIKEDNYNPRIYFIFDKGYLRILSTLVNNDISNQNDCYFRKVSDDIYVYTDKITGNYVKFLKNPFKFIISDKSDNVIIESSEKSFNFLAFTGYDNGQARKIKLCFKTHNECYYGFGERFNRVNQSGLNPDICIFEQFTNQREKTYMPIPFFFTEKGYGMLVNSSFYVNYGLSSETKNLLEIECKVNDRSPFLDLYMFIAEPKEIIREFIKIAGYPVLPPKWAFGLWMSSNRWNTQEETVKQVEITKKLEIPATVLVLEAWSDEATFYIFNDAEYKLNSGEEFFKYRDFSFSHASKWPDPKKMIEFIHENNLKIVLWQIPVIKYFENVENNQHLSDEEYVIENKYCVLNADGTPYRIYDNWFCKSLLLDFTNPEAKEWWFNKRRYLLDDLKVDGFKTDGGEFIFSDEACFYNQKKGDEMRNLYPTEYISAYHDFIGRDHITFSRAGFTGAQNYPLYWAGDQMSSFEEFKSVITAGLSVNLSGNPFWGFDIAGFAGEMPTAELYIRSTQMATFCPVMQFHSAPPEGSENNDRTPWNASKYNEDDRLLDIYRLYANIRMNLLPYIYNEAAYIAKNGEPFMRHLIVDYPDDSNVYNIEDEYLFGRSLLIAPIIDEGSRQRDIYLPDGEWIDFWDGTRYKGSSWITYSCGIDKIPVFIKNDSVIPLNLNEDFEIGGRIGNEMDKYKNLCFIVTGQVNGEYVFSDDLGNGAVISNTLNGLHAEISGNIEKIHIMTRDSSLIRNSNFVVRLNDADYYACEINCVLK